MSPFFTPEQTFYCTTQSEETTSRFPKPFATSSKTTG